MDENKNFAISDNTVLAGLGLLDMDFSLATLTERGPNAASTAVPVKQRDQYLLSEANKENKFISVMKMISGRKTEEDKTVLHAQSENILQDFSEFLDYLARPKTIENKDIEDRESSSSRTSSGSADSDLYPGSSILRQSHLISFNDEEDEVDVMKAGTPDCESGTDLLNLGLPSYLIGESAEGITESHEGVWDDDDELDPAEKINHTQEFESPDLLNDVDLRTVGNSRSSRSETPSHIPLIICSDSDADNNDRPEESGENLISEQDAVENEEFHSINLREFSVDEEQAAVDANYEIDGTSFADKSDFSGYINPDDVSVRSSMWSGIANDNDGLEIRHKPSIEEIFALKSEKLGSLTGEMPSFGYGKSTLQSPQKFVNDKTLLQGFDRSSQNCPFDNDLVSADQTNQHVRNRHLLQTFVNADLSSAPEREAPNMLNTFENNNENITCDNSGERSVSFQRSFIRNENNERISRSKPSMSENVARTDSSASFEVNTTNTNLQSPSTYMDMLHKIVERAVKTGTDPKHLVDEMLRNSNRDITASSESVMETSADVLEMRLYREQLKATPRASRHDLQTQQPTKIETIENKQLAIADEEHVVGRGRMKMGTSLLHHSSTTEDSLLHTQQNLSRAPSNSVIHSKPTTPLSSDNAQDKLVIAKSSLTGIRTSAECTVRNPAPQTRIVSISKLDVGIVCENSSFVDFGLVPEYCSAQKEIELINNSDDPLPVLIELKSMHGSRDILSWGSNYPNLKYLSSSLAAVELPSKASVRVLVQAKAPGINFFNANGIIEATSMLEMRLDTPYSSSPILAEAPIKIRIGEVLLRTFRNKLPLSVESEAGKFGSSTFTLRNKSLFPLDLSFKIMGNETLGVSPEKLSIPSQEDANVQINFTPSLQMGQAEVEGKILIKVNPEGLEMDLPIRAHSFLPYSSHKEAVKWLPTPSVKRPSTPSLPTVSQEILEDKPLISEKMRLLCNTHTLVFGTVPIGESSSHSLILQNEWSENVMTLQLTLNSEAFYLKVSNEKEKVLSKIVEIPPKGKLNIEVYFAPTETEIYTGSIECRCVGVTIPSKSTFPLYGFGGRGELSLKYEENILSEENGLVLDQLVPKASRLLKPSCINDGSRSIFVKFRFLSDKFERSLSWSDISIEPTEFVLRPGEKKELLMMITGSATVMERVPGIISNLQVIYGDEILRRRFRRFSDKTVKWKKIKDTRLLKINFEDRILREEMFNETELDKYFPHDPVIFYNSCRVSSIPLTIESDNREVSVTMVDVTLDQNTLCSFSTGSNQTVRGVSHEAAAPINLAAKAAEFDVIPPQLRLRSSQKEPMEVSVVNYSEEDQILEVLWEKQWLSISPREATVPPKSFAVFRVQPLTVNIPQNTPKISQTSFKILGKNDEKEVRVTLEIDTPIFVDKFSHTKIPSLIRRPSDNAAGSQRNIPAEGTAGVEYLKKNASQDHQRVVSKIEVSDEVKFPSTRVFEESFGKLIIKNLDQCDYQMKVVARCQHFAVPYTDSFLVKSQRRVEVTVFFRPRGTGELVDHLSVLVNGCQQSHTVRLSGEAVIIN